MSEESTIKRQICEYLELRGALFWLHITQKMKRKTKYLRTGIADIIGVWKGKPLAIEVKTKTGKASDEQIKFIDDFRKHGGLAFIAKSVEDVQTELEGEDG